MEKYDSTIRPKLAQFRKFFQGMNLAYICIVMGLLDFLITFITYGLYTIFNLGGPLILVALVFCGLVDCSFSLFAAASAIRDVPPKIVPAWKKELFVYSVILLYDIISPLGRIWISFTILSTGGTELQVIWGCILMYCIILPYVAASLVLSYFIQEVTYVVNLVKDTTPSDREVV